MRVLRLILAVILLCVPLCSCGNTPQSVETEQSSEAVVESATPTSAEEPTPEPIVDLTLNADGSLDGMTYKYNDQWIETSDPLTNAVLRSYDINLGDDGMAVLMLAAVNDEATSATVQALRTQSDDEREQIIVSMITAKEGTLDEAKLERASIPPSGTRAMWAFEGQVQGNPNEYVHGYTYVGGSQLYEVSVTTNSEEAYIAFEPTWKSLVNQLQFQEIEPVTMSEPTPVPTPVPIATPESVDDDNHFLGQWYVGRWEGPEDDGTSWLELNIEPSSDNPNGYTVTGTRTFPESDPSFFKLSAVEDGDNLVYTGTDTSNGREVRGSIALGDGSTPNVVVSLAYDKYQYEIVMWFYLDKA